MNSLKTLKILNTAMEQMLVGVLITRQPDNQVVCINSELSRILGLEHAPLENTSFRELFFDVGGKFFYPNEKVIYNNMFYSHLKSETHVVAKDFEAIVQQPGGAKTHVLVNSSPVLNEARQVIAMVTVLQDISAKKKEQMAHLAHEKELEENFKKQTENLQKTNRQLKTILNASSESIWICDGQGVVLRINQATEKLLGITSEKVIGKQIDDLVNKGMMDRSVTREVLNRKCQVNIIQNTAKTKKRLLVTGTPVFDDDGSISMVITNERDMTQLNDLHEELELMRLESKQIKDELTQLNLRELKEQEIVAESKEMQHILLTCQKLANLKISNILIMGESGTGKGLLAKFIHSRKNKGPFVQINCAALPESLIEAELFGYEKGAFTGAGEKGKIGLFEMARGGTLFLDEIGEMTLPMQAKLLKCIEDKEVLHIGGLTPIKIDCTVIAATNVKLVDQIKHQKFRQDLYFRLNTFAITIPPLRERVEDIPGLIFFFLNKYNKEYDLQQKLSPRSLNAIQAHAFPGNIRELQNMIKKAVVMGESAIIEQFDKGEFDNSISAPPHDGALELKNSSYVFNDKILSYEKKLLSRAVKEFKTTRGIAAALHMTQSQVFRKLKKHGLSA
ncbi:MAG: sigma 54-interacting transcriptional regulator [Desulfobacterium sp.]